MKIAFEGEIAQVAITEKKDGVIVTAQGDTVTLNFLVKKKEADKLHIGQTVKIDVDVDSATTKETEKPEAEK